MYFEKKGPDNTDVVIELAVKKATELNLSHVVVASKSGATALKLSNRGLSVVCVSYHVGFSKPGVDMLPPAARQQLAENNIPVLTTTHLLAGVDRAVKNKFGGIYPSELMAHTLRMFGEGTKVCVEIAGMALDAGLIPYGEDVVAVAGSGTGADTALIVRPAHSNNFFDTKISEIICKPRNF